MPITRERASQMLGRTASFVADGHQHQLGYRGDGGYVVRSDAGRMPCVICGQRLAQGIDFVFGRAYTGVPSRYENFRAHLSCAYGCRDGSVLTIESPIQPVPPVEEVRFCPTVMIGADPELELRNSAGYMTYPRNVGIRGLHSRLGVDGAGSSAEIRPRPGTPEVVYASIRQSMRTLARRANDYSFTVTAGSGIGTPLGGHIHFSGIAGQDGYIRHDPPSGMVDCLDELITRPLNAVSLPSSYAMRTVSHRYGRLPGQVRSQPHGWEYRAPLSWLVTPEITRGVLAAAYVIAATYDPAAGALRPAGTQGWPTNREELIGRSGRYARDIRAFYAALDEMVAHGSYLEHTEVIAAWGGAPAVRVPRTSQVQTPVAVPTTHWNIALTGSRNDTNVPAIVQGVGFTRGLMVYGARQDRTPDNVIFLSRDLYQQFRGAVGTDIRRWHDSAPQSTIWISWSLRQDIPMARDRLIRVLQAIENGTPAMTGVS